MAPRRPTIAELRELLELDPLPHEGGFFRSTWRSPQLLAPAALDGAYPEEKPVGTAILYLVTGAPDGFSAIHRLPTAETFHFYLGDPVETLLLSDDGSGRIVRLGADILAGERVQFTVPADVWQGTRLVPGGEYALLGTTMAPGYTSSDFRLATRAELLAGWPAYADSIGALTRD